MKSVIALLACLAAVASATTLDFERAFNLWKAEHGVEYTTAEEHALRFDVFKANALRVAEHNALNLGWTMALNQFGDLTADEFGDRYIGGFRNVRSASNPVDTSLLRVKDTPSSVDWSQKGAVTPIKNQGQCGSCWAFSTTGSTEGVNFIATGNLVSLSEQQLVDCSGSFGNQGCNGGLMDNAFKYIISNKGICTEASYPYTASDGTCKSSSCTLGATISGYSDVPSDNDGALAAAIVKNPVSIAVEADQSSFQFYSGGVMTGSCGTALDHGVLAVGYGTMSGTDYWKVKNSWGASWGDKGYILLERNGGKINGGAGQCGLLSQPSYPKA